MKCPNRMTELVRTSTGQRSLRGRRRRDRSRRKTVPVAAGEELDEDDGYEPSIREENPEGDDAHVDDIPGADEDGDDDDDRVPATDDIPEDDQPDEDEIGVEHGTTRRRR